MKVLHGLAKRQLCWDFGSLEDTEKAFAQVGSVCSVTASETDVCISQDLVPQEEVSFMIVELRRNECFDCPSSTVLCLPSGRPEQLESRDRSSL